MRAVSFVILAASSVSAYGHDSLTYPPARYSDLFNAPCGRSPETARDHVTTLHSGAKIVVTWNQIISNQGHLRVSFDSDGEDDFINPPDLTSFYSAPSVLVDNIPIPPFPDPGAVEVTLPNVECQNCTLQLLQVLSDHLPFGSGGDDFHYQCADLVLINDTLFFSGFEA